MTIGVQYIVDNERIPTPPGVAMQLLEISQNQDAAVADLTRIISVDPKLSAKIVGYCNTPIMGIGRETTSLEAAVVILGMRSVTMLALSFSLMENKDTESTFDFVDFWNRSLAFAISCKVLGKAKSINADECFLLGLLLRIGKIGIGSTYAAEIAEIQSASTNAGTLSQFDCTEQFAKQHELDEFIVGGKLLEKWHFPEAMSGFVTNYSTGDDSDEQKSVFRSAEQVAGLILTQESSEEDILLARAALGTLLGWEEEEFNTNYDSIVSEYGECAKLLDFKVGAVCSIADLELKAKEMLIKTSLGMATEIQQISHEREQLKSESMIDALTGLNNRRAYDTQVPQFLLAARDRNEPFVLAVVDIDHFKKFNDTYGHAAGDEVLRAVGHVVRDVVRGTDCVFRFGGEEFVFVLSNCTPEQTQCVVERVRKAVEDLAVVFEDQTLKVTISTGVSWQSPDLDIPLDDQFKNADRLLYVAKDRGRNQYAFERYQEPTVTPDGSPIIPPASMKLPDNSTVSH